MLDNPSAGSAVIVQGGDKSSKSTNITTDGVAWKLISITVLLGASQIVIITDILA